MLGAHMNSPAAQVMRHLGFTSLPEFRRQWEALSDADKDELIADAARFARLDNKEAGK